MTPGKVAIAEARPPRFWRDALLLAGSVLAALLLIEAFCRLAIDDGMRLDLEMWKYARLVKQANADASKGHVHRPNAEARLMGVDVRTNEYGFRGPAVAMPKPPGVRRVLMLGDSLTMGWGVREADTTSALVAERLAAAGRFEVVNAGVGNFNTAMAVDLLESAGLRVDPDIVVLNYYINDAEPTPQPRSNLLTRNSLALAFVLGRLDTLERSLGAAPDWRRYYADLYRDDRPGWMQTRRMLSRFAEICRARSLGCVVVNLPELRVLRDYPFADVAAKVEAEVRRTGLPYADMLPAVQDLEPGTLWISPEDAHPNAIANRRFADRIAQAVLGLAASRKE